VIAYSRDARIRIGSRSCPHHTNMNCGFLAWAYWQQLVRFWWPTSRWRYMSYCIAGYMAVFIMNFNADNSKSWRIVLLCFWDTGCPAPSILMLTRITIRN